MFQIKKIQKENKKKEMQNDSDCQDASMVSNILDNILEIGSDEQSMFINLNIRNRRQKVLHNISFETEMYDIYDPYFTSEDESSDTSSSYESSEIV
jgi:hypothetical protein